MALAVGAIVRAAALPLAGTGDVLIWKTWSYNAAVNGAGRLYGVGATSEEPSQYHLLRFDGFEAIADYPPLALEELGLVGRAYGYATNGHFPNTRALTVVIKALPVAFEIGLVGLLFLAVRRTSGESAARWAAVGYWLNPAAIISASVGGYLDTLFVLPAAGSLVAAVGGWPAISGGLIAASVLTKPQGIFIVPAVIVALWNAGDPADRRSRMTAALGGAVLVSAAIVAPVVAAGAWWNMVHGLRSQTNEIYVSMEGYNVWWIAGHFMWVAYAWQRSLSAWSVFTAPVIRIPFVRAAAHGLPDLRVVGTMLATAGILWGAWIGRRARDLSLVAAVGAFSVHAYAVLGAQVHENHLFAALPLLIIAAAARRRFVPILSGVSAFLALSMIFYILSDEEGPIVLSRTLTLVDTTLLLAVLNCVLLVWHAKVLQAEARV
jgi:hypothetical protein